MNVIPVVEREMRVAAREPNTYRLRFLAAFLTVLFSGFSLWIVTLVEGTAISPRELFIALTWIEFVFVMIAGFSLTADAISEEKRESTLGLLFLTDLKGPDIVLGKLAAAAARGIFALIGTFPVLALPLMMGGTNGPEFARVMGVLLVALLFSMAVGMMFSAFLQRSWTAYGISAAVVIGFAIGLPAVTELIQELYGRGGRAVYLQIPSPSFALIMSFSTGWGLSINHFYISLAVLLGISGLMLASAAGVLPFVWKDRPAKGRGLALRRALANWRWGTPEFRLRLRRRMLAINPVYWLSSRELAPAWGFMMVVALLGLANLYLTRRDWPPGMSLDDRLVLPFLFWMLTTGMIHSFLFLRVPIMAAERFGEDRKSGALELLISTPMSVEKILRGHWLGVGRYLAGPALAALFIHVLAIFHFVALQPLFTRRSPSFSQMLMEAWQHFAGREIHNDWEINFILMIMTGLIPVLMLSWISLAHLGAYLSLRVKRPLAIPMMANGLLHAPPWLAWTGVLTVIEYNRWKFNHGFSEACFYYALAFTFECLSQVFWIWWCRRQLIRNFRTAATDRYQPPKRRRWWQIRIA
jgi:ABC-type transport system involved in multi-copper enzyme maturation permease subunit